jgi:SAM-dependent methyltransferase
MSMLPWEPDQRDEFRATFDDDPDAYDRTRPVAPEHVFDDVVQLAGLQPASTVVEIGPGTGQATRPLAQRGLRVVALELGPRLAERARQNLAAFPAVEVVTSSFETWDPGDSAVDAVFACNSFHWIDPDIRFVKSAAVLKPDGHLVELATPWVIPDDADQFWWDVQEDYVAVGGKRVDPSTKHPDRIGDLGAAVRASGLFAEPTIKRYRFGVTFTADDYAISLSTQSGVKAFPRDARTELVERIRRRVQQRGGTVTAHLLAVLTVAERAS